MVAGLDLNGHFSIPSSNQRHVPPAAAEGGLQVSEYLLHSMAAAVRFFDAAAPASGSIFNYESRSTATGKPGEGIVPHRI
jgi:hypothetical protein